MEGIKAAAVAVRAGAGEPGLDDLAGLHNSGGLGRINAGAADRSDEEAASGEGGVAHDFGIEAQAGLAGEEEVAGVYSGDLEAEMGGLAVCGGGDDEPVERFGVKAGVDELEGQPIEEFGMRGGRALSAKVVFGFDQALAEVALPDTVDGDAGEEWVLLVRDPAGEV